MPREEGVLQVGPPGRGAGGQEEEGEDLSEKKGDTFVLNRRGARVCEGYNRGKCGSAKPQGHCKNKHSHQCNLCLGPHSARKLDAKPLLLNKPLRPPPLRPRALRRSRPTWKGPLSSAGFRQLEDHRRDGPGEVGI